MVLKHFQRFLISRFAPFQMNSVARPLLRIAASKLSTREWFVVQSYSTSTAASGWTKSKGPAPTRWTKSKASTPTTAEKPSPPPPPSELGKEWPRPSEIPFQKKVANSVRLIGVVDMPVQFQPAPDGKFWAGTVITQKGSSESPALWIPVIFEGDLAHVVACHLKKKDHVYIEGELKADPPHLDATNGQANIQVMVHNVNFVEPLSPENVGSVHQTPKKTPGRSNSTEQAEDLSLSPWKDLLDNPKEWSDYRSRKLDGSVKPKHPDFKRKGGGLSLWLDAAPDWFLSELGGCEFDNPIQKTKEASPHKELGGLKFDNPIQKTKQVKPLKGDEAWKDLVENPDKWWDNRLDKKNVRAPDFKHKDTGDGLWIDSSPGWVRSKLPSPKGKLDKGSKQ